MQRQSILETKHSISLHPFWNAYPSQKKNTKICLIGDEMQGHDDDGRMKAVCDGESVVPGSELPKIA